MAKIRRGTFFAITVAAGRHILRDATGVPAFVDVEAGGESFVRLDQELHTGEPATSVLSVVQPEVARQEMRFVLYIDAKQILASSVARADPSAPSAAFLKSRTN